jgi:hypothetical protein
MSDQFLVVVGFVGTVFILGAVVVLKFKQFRALQAQKKQRKQ